MLPDDTKLAFIIEAHVLEEDHLPLLDERDGCDQLPLHQRHLARNKDERPEAREHAEQRVIREHIEEGGASDGAAVDRDGETCGEGGRQVLRGARV